ncbi:mitochondrial fission process protein 1 [Leptinotarsa decemlineata]|uniref:mitochondrial fission process protein 1 n=1 Tax=Leptinotarsa decemlineata TaxID=7539 RepID=UPI000C25518C|nr:mitochondrial fission process protein 1 [Leptinotarsa decemlineata]
MVSYICYTATRYIEIRMGEKNLDLYRQTPIRYLGYSNEVGEAFRSIIGRKWVNFSYAVASFYVLADTADKSAKSYKIHYDEIKHTKKVLFTTADTLIWQLLASVILPGYTINRVCALSGFLINRSRKVPKNTSKWIVTGIGLITIPFIIKPIDRFVDYALDSSLRKFQP